MTALVFTFGLAVGAVIVASVSHFRINYLQDRVNSLARLFFGECEGCDCEDCKKARGESA